MRFGCLLSLILVKVKCEENVCLLPAETGMCRARFRRYYYNSDTQKCEHFTYGGCGGNGNSFSSIEDCQEKCTKVNPNCFDPKNDGSSRSEKYETGPRQKKLKIPELRFYYNNTNERCEAFRFHGPYVNRNNFATLKDCINNCNPLLMKDNPEEHSIKPGCKKRMT